MNHRRSPPLPDYNHRSSLSSYSSWINLLPSRDCASADGRAHCYFFPACFLSFFILFSGRRLRCAGALRGLRSLPGYSRRVACAHWLCLHHTEEFSYKSVVDHFSKGKNIYIYIYIFFLCASVLLPERAAVEQGDEARGSAAIVQLLLTLKEDLEDLCQGVAWHSAKSRVCHSSASISTLAY